MAEGLNMEKGAGGIIFQPIIGQYLIPPSPFLLSTSSIEFENLPEDFSRRLPHYPIPAALIAQLAVDTTVEDQGLGSRLLIEALQNILAVSGEMVIKVVLADAIDEEAKAYYLRYGFIELPGNDLKLFLPVETIRQLLAD